MGDLDVRDVVVNFAFLLFALGSSRSRLVDDFDRLEETLDVEVPGIDAPVFA